MFSNGKSPTKNGYLNPNDEPWRSNQSLDKRPYSPQTNQLNLPLSSFKSLASGNRNMQQLPTKLTPLLQPQGQLGIRSKIITLVSSNQSSLHFHDEATNVLQRYPNNDIAFVGIWGSVNSDKSFFYDRILNLSDVDGDIYANTSLAADSNAELFFYDRPFIKENIRIFLLDGKGFQNADNLTKNQKNQLDIMIALCQDSTTSQNQSPYVDIVQKGYQHLNQSFRRLYVDKKRKQQQPSEISWPKSLFVLYNTSNSIKKHQKSPQHERELCRMFKDYNFSILHNKNTGSQQQIKTYTTITNPLDELYLKNTSIIFREIFSKIQGKSFMNVKYNGLTYPHILTQIIYSMNQHNSTYLPRPLAKSKKSVLSSVYNKQALAYLLKMKQYIGEEKPYSTDYLIDAFQNASQQTMQQYYETQGEVVVRPSQDSLCLQYEKKLQDYISQKQKNILAVNNKKSLKQLNKKFSPEIVQQDQQNPYDHFVQLQQNLNPVNRTYDNNAQTFVIGNALKSLLTKNMQVPVPVQMGMVQQIVAYDVDPEELNSKKQMLSTKRSQLQKLTVMQSTYQQNDREINKYKQEDQQLTIQIRNMQEKTRQLKTQMNSHLSSGGGSNQLLLMQAKNQIQQLKTQLNVKMGEKRNLQQMYKSAMSPELEMLKTQLMNMKQQKQRLVRTSRMPMAQSGGITAERRVIPARDANIRRVHGSKI